MDPERTKEHLSQIHTLWTTVRRAHGGSASAAAQLRLLERYGAAIRRYLRGALRDPDAAEEVFQEFVFRFLRGDFRRADPDRGRFRDFLKTALYRLVVDHQRQNRRWPEPLTADGPEPADPEDAASALDREFLAVWREALLGYAWEALGEHDRRTGQILSLVLRFHIEHPKVRSPEAARQLGARLGKALSPEWVRKWLARARRQFADLFLDEVARSIQDPRPESLEQELVELGLLDACRPALERRRESILS